MHGVEPSRKARTVRGPGLTRSRPGVEPLEGRALLAGAGALDPTFGSGGVAFHMIDPTGPAPSDVAFQPDGKAVAVGRLASQFVLVRYDADGSPDPTFGADGRVVRNYPPLGGPITSEGLLIQPGGKIVVALNQRAIPNGGGGQDLATLFRFNPDGSLDTTFGAGGAVSGLPAAGIGGLAQDGDRILYVGEGTMFDPTTSIHRLNDDGSVDSGFGTNGVVSTTLPPSGFVNAPALAVEPNGTIVLAGTVFPPGVSFPVAALETYSDAGKLVNHATYNFSAAYPNFDVNSVVVQPDGKLIVAATVTSKFTAYDPVLVRVNPDLTLDRGFGKGGLTLWATNSGNQSFAVLVQPGGGIVVAGDGPINAPQFQQSATLVATRYQQNGAPDTTFGTRGLVVVANVPFQSQTPVRLAPGPNNTLLVAGGVYAVNGGSSVELARLTGTPYAPPPVPAPPAYVFQGLVVKAPARGRFTHPVAALVLPAGFPAADRTLFARSVITWGDGTSSAGTFGAFRGAYAVLGSHAYSRAGTYRTTVTLLGASGGTTKVTHGTIVAG